VGEYEKGLLGHPRLEPEHVKPNSAVERHHCHGHHRHAVVHAAAEERVQVQVRGDSKASVPGHVHVHVDGMKGLVISRIYL
jgi:hypothetical protein